jgi:serine/threonine protein kinase
VTIGDRLGAYEIIAPIGAGGMGEVYRAKDTRLGRDVALKILPPQMATDRERLARFHREARAVAAFNHPNVVTLYSVEESGGVHYLTMELVDGQPLSAAIPPEGWPVERAVDVAVAVTDAIATAHDKGIVHRDLKPANVMITRDGRVKVLDFGLAKEMRALAADDETVASFDQTQAGVVMGTPAYMSPEQISGGAVDHRTDIFSIGLLLYEMATGRRPFQGRTHAELAAAILRDSPLSLSGTHVPSSVATLVERCLAKRAGDRIQDARSLSSELRAASRSSATAAAARPSIAVLPFANLSADKEQEYFSDGLAEEIINLLAKVNGLKVIARTSSFAFRGKAEDVRRIAEALDVTHVLEGSVRRAGARIRVTAQLIAAVDGGQVWSERYDRELTDIFAVQDEISAAIAGALRLKLSAQPAALQRYMPKLPAYDAFLRAKHHLAKVTPESWELAKQCYESAVELDPQFALAHVGLGFYWAVQTNFGRCPPHDAVPAARAAIQRALRIDPALPDAHALSGHLAATYDLDWDAADRHFAFPMAQQVGHPITRPMYGGLEFLRGNIERAIALAERAIEEDPLEVWPHMNLHAYLQGAGRDKDAYAQATRVLELDPNLVVAHVSIAHFHADWGQLPEAVAAARQARAVGPWYLDATATLAALLRVCGEEDEARALYQMLGSGKDFGDSRAQAIYYLLCGDVNTGADWTEKAIAERDGSMMYYLRFVVSKGLRASSRWPAIARMMNLPSA